MALHGDPHVAALYTGRLDAETHLYRQFLLLELAWRRGHFTPPHGQRQPFRGVAKKGQIRTACNMTPRVDKATVTSYGKSFEKRRVVQLWGGKS